MRGSYTGHMETALELLYVGREPERVKKTKVPDPIILCAFISTDLLPAPVVRASTDLSPSTVVRGRGDQHCKQNHVIVFITNDHDHRVPSSSDQLCTVSLCTQLSNDPPGELAAQRLFIQCCS